jgi:spore coat protein JC
MWTYQKNLEFPVKIMKPDPRMATLVVTQYGGPDGELGASLRYLSQRYAMPIDQAKATLNDIGTEELAHFEMVGSMVRQLLEGASVEQIKTAGAGGYYADHGRGVYPVNGNGIPFSATVFQSKGDPITDIYENLAAEQKARSTYEYLINMADDPDVIAPLKFLREREVVHFQRFGETLELLKQEKARKKLY